MLTAMVKHEKKLASSQVLSKDGDEGALLHCRRQMHQLTGSIEGQSEAGDMPWELTTRIETRING